MLPTLELRSGAPPSAICQSQLWQLEGRKLATIIALSIDASLLPIINHVSMASAEYCALKGPP
jgi:hypothetical protein